MPRGKAHKQARVKGRKEVRKNKQPQPALEQGAVGGVEPAPDRQPLRVCELDLRPHRAAMQRAAVSLENPSNDSIASDLLRENAARVAAFFTEAENEQFNRDVQNGLLEVIPSMILPYRAHPAGSPAAAAQPPSVDPIFHSEWEDSGRFTKFPDLLNETYLVKEGCPENLSVMMQGFGYFIEVRELDEEARKRTEVTGLLCVFRVEDCTTAVTSLMDTNDPEELYDCLFTTVFGGQQVAGTAAGYPSHLYTSHKWFLNKTFSLTPVARDFYRVSRISIVPDDVICAYRVNPQIIEKFMPIKISGPATLNEVDYHVDFGQIYHKHEVPLAEPRSTIDPSVVCNWDIDEDVDTPREWNEFHVRNEIYHEAIYSHIEMPEEYDPEARP